MDLVEGIDKAKHIANKLLGLGATRTKIIQARDIVVDQRVRHQCSHSGCDSYGKLMCPPNLPPIRECQNTLNSYLYGILLQSHLKLENQASGDMDHSFKKQVFEGALNLHHLVYEGEQLAFKMGFPFPAGFIGGACHLCSSCSPTCKNPHKARPSMEGMGIDVIETSQRAANWTIAFNDSKINWTGLILLD